MSRLVTIFGGSGFVGRYVARRMARAGWRVRVAVRRPNEALFVRPYGVVGQVEPVIANIRDDASVAAAMNGADAVVNCVGILAPSGRNDFGSVHADGAGRVARVAAELGIDSLVHVSAMGADPDSDSAYSRTKAAGEAAVTRHVPDAVILRPSVIFGTEDQFFNRFATMAKLGPILPIVGGRSKFQPVHVDDVARVVELALVDGVTPGVYELGGPDTESLRELVDEMLRVIRRRPLVLNLPFWKAGMIAWILDAVETVTLGLVSNGILTRDQLANLRRDNVASGSFPGFAELGIEPLPYRAIIPDYLWRHRPSGQYAEIKESASDLRA